MSRIETVVVDTGAAAAAVSDPSNAVGLAVNECNGQMRCRGRRSRPWRPTS